MRGRLLLAGGRTWDELHVLEQLDVAEAAIVEEGAMRLDALDEWVAEVAPDRETWGSSDSAIKAAQAAQDMFAPKPKGDA